MDSSYINYQIDLKKFKKGKRINKGGFGTIYSIEEIETGKQYAAKVIDCGDDEEQCKKMIDREIGIMMYANHPTIIKLIGFSLQDFLEENNITIIMDLANNGSLADILQKIEHGDCPNDYTNTTRQIILVGVARGMKYLHDRNIIHRDVKAGNILIGDNYYPLITDFGMSKVFDVGHSKSQSQCGGTLSYMAPEVIKDCPYDRKADVYSFGILMYEIVTDSIAYPDLENGKIKEYEFKNKVANENLRPEFKFPIKKSIKNLIEQCWSNDPNVRPTFDEIYYKLSNCKNSDNDERISEENYLLDNINMDQFNDYIEKIANEPNPFENILVKKNEILEEKNKLLEKNILNLKEDNQKLLLKLDDHIETSKSCNNELLTNLQYQNKLLKDSISISSFNSFPLKMQQIIINDLIENQKDQKTSQIFINLNSLLLYMLNLEPGNQNFIQLFSNHNDQQFLSKIEESKIVDLILSSEATSFLFNKKSFDSDDFISIITNISNIRNIIFNTQYPSEIFEKVNTTIDNINKRKEETKNDNKSDFRISVCITGINEIDKTFQNNNKIIEVVIESPISRIIGSCFSSCSNLEKVTLPNSIVVINYSAFQNCRSLKEINLPSSLITIESNAFCGCSSLEEILIPNSVINMGSMCFAKCYSLKKVNLPYSIQVITDHLFSDCNNLESIEIPYSVVTIEQSAFEHCISLKVLEIPKSVIEIGNSAFASCSSLKTINFKGNVKVRKIGENAFSGCNSLRVVLIPDSVTEIDNYCFGSCSSLYHAIIPPNISIGYGAFTNRVSCYEKK